MNFLFTDGRGNHYVGTAGHCALAAAGEKEWSPGAGPVAAEGGTVAGDANPIGRFAYAIWRGPHDFALIRLEPDTEWNPEMCHFGGPDRIDSSRRDDPVELQFFGNGVGIGNLQVVNQTVLPARTVTAPNTSDRDEVQAEGVAMGGDSGAPVTVSETNRAIGVLVKTQGETTIVFTRLKPVLQRAGAALDARLRLIRPT